MATKKETIFELINKTNGILLSIQSIFSGLPRYLKNKVLFFVLVISVFSVMSFAQTPVSGGNSSNSIGNGNNSTNNNSKSESEYHWYQGKEKVSLTLIPNQMVEFGLLSTSSGAQKNKALKPGSPLSGLPLTVGSLSFKPIKEKKLKGGVRLLTLQDSDFALAMKTFSDSGITTKVGEAPRHSPLFRDAQGGLKALAGGVLITFKMGTTDEVIQEWCQRLDLKRKKKYSLEGQPPTWLIETPAGIESLDKANEFFENHKDLVEKSQPNFWQPLNTRELRL